MFYFVHTDGIKRSKSPSGARLGAFRATALTMRTFNVGDGEAILLSRGAEGVLFDGGAGRKKVNEPLARALAAYLAQEKIRLRALVATHPHLDHLNALSALLAVDDPPSLAADTVLYHNGEAMGRYLSETLGARMNALSRSGRLAVEPVTTGMEGRGLAGVEMYHFVDGRSKPGPEYKSISTLAWYGSASFLFTGDAYAEYEADLLASPVGGLLRADVLKVTHHGSEHGTSQPFVDAVLPRISVASTAADAGHRLENVIKARLEKVGEVFDTFGRGGDVIVSTDGKASTRRTGTGVLYEVRVETPGWYLGGTW